MRCTFRIALCALFAASTASSSALEPRWHPFRSHAGRFQVLAPGAPERLVESRWTLAGRIDEVAYHFDWRGERYGVTYHDLPRIARVIFSVDGLLDRAVEELMKEMNGELRSEEPISVQGSPGRALAYDVRDSDGLLEQVRILLVGQRLYLVEAAIRRADAGRADARGPGSDAAETSTATRFFESFQLLD